MHAQQILFVFCIVLSIGISSIHSAASNSLADCQAVASQFRTTINYTATNITGTTGVNVTCSDMSVYCPGQNISGVCIWQRKLSAVCRNASGVIKIRIQTNNLPPRCAKVPNSPFVQVNIDFEVNFNPDVSINTLNKNLSTVSSLSQTLCTLTSAATVPSASGFVNYGANLNTATGVSVDGVVIFTPDSLNNVDPFFPTGGFAAESVDTCLAHCQATGIYHYHIGTGCMLNPPTGSISSCNGVPACSSNIANYSITSFSSYQTKTVIGIAKDGHIIYGPYLSSNSRVTSGFDVCNGMFHDSTGNYGYFATSTYPYLVGCFGPGNYPSFGPNCTTNGPISYTMSSFASSFLNNGTSSTGSFSSTSPAMPGQSTAQPVAGQSTMQQMSGQSTAQPVAGQSTMQQIPGQTTASGQPRIQQMPGQTTAQPV